MLASSLVHGRKMPFMLISHSDRRLSLKPGTARPLGRADVGRCPESMFVSRQQCLISVSADGSQVQLQHTGSGNPTLVIRAGDQRQQLLKQGEAVQLSAGDALALVATRPTDVLRLVLVEESAGDNHHQQQQQQLQPLRSFRAGPVVAAAAVSGREDGLNPSQRPAAAAAGTAAAGTAAGGQAPADGAAAGTSAAGTSAAAAAGGSAPVVQPHPANPVMLLLVGIPGSGKSTFATSLARTSGRSWARVNQDSIRGGGKPGSRAQCVNAARRALAAGHNVVIDRCNLEPSQRTDFLALAAAAAASVHCLFINLPTGLCIKRAAGRSDHEGGVDGPGAARVVNRMAASLKKADPISAAQEGFSSVTTAVNDQQVAAALQHWAAAAVGIAATEAAAEQQSQQQQSQQQPAAAAAAEEVCTAEPPAKRARSDSPTLPPAAAGAAGALQRPRQQQQQQTKVQQDRSTPAKQGTPAAAAAGGSAVSPGRSAFAVLMASAKQKQQQQQQQQSAKSPKGGTPARGAPPAPTTAAAAAAAAGRAAADTGGAGGGGAGPALGWSSALAQIAADPERFRGQAFIWHVDDQVVGLLDKFPKSTVHGLLVVRQPGLDSVDVLGQGGGQQQQQQHLALLAHMREVALTWIHQQQQPQQSGQQEGGSSGADNSSSSSIPPGWRVGFHSIPSMAQLHLHILSDDLVSPWLKTKKHWNSFTSPFFLHLDDVVAELQRTGSVHVDRAQAESLLKGPLVCHKCAAGVQLPNMPQLKAHLLTHVG